MNEKDALTFKKFMTKGWGIFSFWLPPWVYLIISCLIYSSQYKNFIIEFVGSFVFGLIILFIIYLFVKNKKNNV